MEMLYHSVSDLVRLANEHQIPLWKVVLLADVQERQVTVEESFETMRQMYQAMRQADQEYDGSIVSASGMAGGDGEKLHAYNASGRIHGACDGKSGENGRVQRLYETNRGGSDGGRMRGDSGGIFVV